MTMPDIDLAELDRLHAKATKAEWFYVASMTDEESMRPGGTYVDVVIASEDEDSRPVSVLDGPSDSDAELIAALHNAYPSLRARIAELERKAAAWDAVKGNIHEAASGTGKFEGYECDAWWHEEHPTTKAISAAVAAKNQHQKDD